MTDRERWEAAWADLSLTAPPGILDAVLARYAEPHRAYHTLDHVRECLAAFDPVRAHARRPAEVALALWYHDADSFNRRLESPARANLARSLATLESRDGRNA